MSQPTHHSTAPGTTDDMRLQLDRIIDIMRRLRDPETGCPWDVEQDFASIAPYTIEEAYEVADAVHRGDIDDIRDELGDLLLQVVFQSRIAEEAGLFSLADVARSISDKMVERHPHVFGDDARPQVAEQTGRWEAIKAEERARKGHTGVLDDVAAGLPPMLRALKLQKRAARVGFDWLNIDDIIAKLHEETAELREEVLSEPPDKARIEDEVGDVLFVAVNLARRAGVDPETALMSCNSKFESRFRFIEKHAEKIGKSLEDMSLDEMESLWQEAKSDRRAPG
ncbi:MAG: nucleoside triphosphate pyrophosphohydrolase [Candidatus Puniceispirillaceae bacterium]